MKSEFELGKDPKRIVKTRKLHQLPIDTRKTGWKQDLYYNPKEFRGSKTSSPLLKANRPADKKDTIDWVFILVILPTIVVLAYYGMRYFPTH